MHPRRRLLSLALALPLVAAGCSTGAPTPPATSDPVPATAVKPSDGVSLRQLGFTNGPIDRVFLPGSVQLTRKVDQVNVTTAFGPVADGPAVLAYLRRTLPAAGWVVDADAGGSLLFHGAAYNGAYAQSSDLWALTLRRQPS